MKETYSVADGFDWVNGARVPESRTVQLTPAEAAYDLGLARISPALPATTVDKSAPPRLKATD